MALVSLDLVLNATVKTDVSLGTGHSISDSFLARKTSKILAAEQAESVKSCLEGQGPRGSILLAQPNSAARIRGQISPFILQNLGMDTFLPFLE